MSPTSSFIRKFLLLLNITLVLALQACGGGGGGGGVAPGHLAITVSTGTPAAALAGVSVLVFDGGTNAPVASGTTDAAGKFTASNLSPGSYYVKLNKQGYNPIPASALLTPVPQAVVSSQTTAYAASMSVSALSGTGWISGKVSAGSTVLANVLVAVEAAGAAYTSITNSKGEYAVYNVPAAGYTVQAYARGYAFAPVSATVSGGVGTTTNVSATAIAGAAVPVNFNLIAQSGVTKPATMLVSLVHPVTRETIPGLAQTQAFQNALSYNFSGVANGNYLVRSTFANDTIVVDPDYIVKFGEPAVAVAGGTPTPTPVQITATGAVGLVSPTNAMTSTTPAATSATPTLSWNAYSSTTDYVLEVVDADSGSLVWGGFSGMGTPTPTKNIVVPGAQTSYTYNGPALTLGKTYRWRVYASKDDNQAATGWRLISMSEDQMGLFKPQ